MKKSSHIYKISIAAFGLILSGIFNSIAIADNYYRVSTQERTPAPRPSKNNNVAYNLSGQEAAPYAYSYVNSLPNDGHWRWVEERCYNSSSGQTCVEGHWVRKVGNSCEEVSSHSVRTGNYIKIIAGGRSPNCR